MGTDPRKQDQARLQLYDRLDLLVYTVSWISFRTASRWWRSLIDIGVWVSFTALNTHPRHPDLPQPAYGSLHTSSSHSTARASSQAASSY